MGPDELFVTHLTTSLRADELLTEVSVPVPPPRTGSAFVEFARRHGDFALGGAAVLVTLAADGTCERARIALLAAAPTPLRAREAEQVLEGAELTEVSAAAAAARAVVDVHPTGDIHGGSEYRRGLVEAMVRRAVLRASQRAKEAT